MDENKVIRPMDFVRLTNIDELNVIKDTKNHIGLVKEVSRDGRMSIIWIGETYNPQTEVYSGFGSTEVESRAMLLIDLLDKKVLTLSDLNLKSLNRI